MAPNHGSAEPIDPQGHQGESRAAGVVVLHNGRYRLRQKLGKGGMGAVYLAEDTLLPGRLVAVKENLNTTAAAQSLFKREALLLARLRHPNLPQVTDYFIEPDGRQYLVMDYVPGENLSQMLHARKGPLPPAEALAIVEQVMRALAYMHTWRDPESGHVRPVIHRDIKPANIKRTPEGHVVLVDFGIAKLESGTLSGVGGGTSLSAKAMTPGYAPLEQYNGGTDARSDIYALGATLYALLSGKAPPTATDMALAGSKPGAQLMPGLKGLPPAAAKVIERAMQTRPADRFQTVADMHQALFGRPLATGAGAAAAASGRSQDSSSARRPGWPAAALTVAALLLAAGLGWLLLSGRGEQTTAGSAPTSAAVAAAPTATPVEEPPAELPAAEPTEPPAPSATPAPGATMVEAAAPLLSTATPADASPPTSTSVAVGGEAPTTDAASAGNVVQTATADALLAEEAVDIAAALEATGTNGITGTIGITDAVGTIVAAGALATSTPAGASSAAPGTATVRPTSTRIATSTPVPSATPTPTPWPTATALPVPTMIQDVIAAADNVSSSGGPTSVVILGPPDRTSTDTATVFSWQPDAPLAEGQEYEVAFWEPGQGPEDGRGWSGGTKGTSISITPPDFTSGKSYRWGVWLRADDGTGRTERVRFLGGGNSFDVPGSGGTDDTDANKGKP